MTLPLLISLAVLSLLFFLLRKKRLGVSIGFLGLSYFILVGVGFLPDLLLKNLEILPKITFPEWRAKNVIVVLGGGVTRFDRLGEFEPLPFNQTRVQKGAELYQACKDTKAICHVIASGGDPQGKGVAEAVVYKNHLEKLGVAASDVFAESESKNTYQNAQFSSLLIREGGYDQAILVTSGVHLKRSFIFFTHFGAVVVPIASDLLEEKDIGTPLIRNIKITDMAMHEFMGMAKFCVYTFLGLNGI